MVPCDSFFNTFDPPKVSGTRVRSRGRGEGDREKERQSEKGREGWESCLG
jgi:hypothetical protein